MQKKNNCKNPNARYVKKIVGKNDKYKNNWNDN